MYFSCYHHRICTRLSLAWALLFLGALVMSADALQRCGCGTIAV
jgi:hypothetical protein